MRKLTIPFIALCLILIISRNETILVEESSAADELQIVEHESDVLAFYFHNSKRLFIEHFEITELEAERYLVESIDALD